MYTLGIILARAGSRGVRNKCVRPLLGKPLITYTFDHALAASLDGLVLSTDSPQAQDLARRREILCFHRPTDLATDTAPIDDVLRQVVGEWERRQPGVRVDAVVGLYANIPIRRPGAIDECVQRLRESGATSVRTIAPVGKHHPDWLHRLDGDRMTQFRPNSIYRRQDLDPLYYHDGAVLVVRRETLFAAAEAPDPRRALWGDDPRAVIQQPDDAVDIDTPLDFHFAEALIKARRVYTEAPA